MHQRYGNACKMAFSKFVGQDAAPQDHLYRRNNVDAAVNRYGNAR